MNVVNIESVLPYRRCRSALAKIYTFISTVELAAPRISLFFSRGPRTSRAHIYSSATKHTSRSRGYSNARTHFDLNTQARFRCAARQHTIRRVYRSKCAGLAVTIDWTLVAHGLVGTLALALHSTAFGTLCVFIQSREHFGRKISKNIA